MDTSTGNLSQQTTRSVGSGNLNTMQGSPGTRSVLSHDHARCAFKPWVMITFFSLHWIASWVISTTGIVLIFKPFSAESPCHLFYLMVYLRAGYWFGTYKMNEGIKEPCRKLVDQDYALYESLTTYRKAPLQIVTYWNTALIAFNGYARNVFDQIGARDSEGTCKQPIDNDLLNALQSPQLVIVIFCVIESIALSCFYVLAFARLIKASAPSTIQYTELQEDLLNTKQKLRQQAEQIKMQQKKHDQLKKRASDIGILEHN